MKTNDLITNINFVFRLYLQVQSGESDRSVKLCNILKVYDWQFYRCCSVNGI